MSRHLLSALAAPVLVVACASTSATAHTQGWRFDPARCPDLVEDYRDRRESRRDERYNHGVFDRIEDRLDRRESRRDERVTTCPASAWVWRGDRPYRATRPAAAAVYFDAYDRVYYRYGPDRVRINIVIP